MLTITITTPLGDIEIQHSKQRAKAVGSREAVEFWKSETREGLYGVHGHLFDMNSCDIADVINAAVNSVGSENIKIPRESQIQADKDLLSYPSDYPKGHLP